MRGEFSVQYWAWAAIFIAIAAFEAWAVLTGHHTLSQSVQHGAGWFRWSIGIGLTGLAFHLFVWR